MQFQKGQRVRVNGVLPWSDWRGTRVSSDATVLEVKRLGLLVTIDRVGPDPGVTITVPKKLCDNPLEALLERLNRVGLRQVEFKSQVSGVEGNGLLIKTEPLDHDTLGNDANVHQVAILTVIKGDINLHRRAADGTFWFLDTEID